MDWPRELLEREDELRRLKRSFEVVQQGCGQFVLVEGEPGIGKTTLLQYARALAQEAGFRCLTSRGTRLERSFAFGIARQLFVGPVRAAGTRDRERLLAGTAGLVEPLLGFSRADAVVAPSPDTLFATLHGLYWLTANLTTREPLVLLVDDGHWADVASLQFLTFLGPRLPEHSLLLIVATRINTGAWSELREDVARAPGSDVLRPKPLSESAVAELVERQLGAVSDSAFSSACHLATGGNPFYVHELLAELQHDAVKPVSSNARAVRTLRPEGVSRSLVDRLRTLPSGALHLARAVAVLGGETELADAATLSGLPLSSAAEAADALVAASVLADAARLSFVHPIAHTAIYNDMGRHYRAQAHLLAAELLWSRGRPAEEAAAHLLAAEAGDHPLGFKVLRQAARDAILRGALETGIDYYRHALAQARETGARSEVLFELGQAEAAAGRVEAREHLERALAECVERVRRAEIVTALSRSVAVAGGAEQSMQILRGEIDHFDSADDDASMLFGTEVLAAAQFVVEAQSLIPPRLDVVERLPHAHDNHRLLAFLAQRAVFSNEPATKAVELGSRAIGDGRLLATETAYSPFCRYAIDALTLAGAYDRAAEACQWMLADARDRGSMAATLYASLSRCLLFLHRGSVVDAEAEATAALEMAVQPGLTLFVPAAAGLFLESLIERADLQAAESVLEDAGLAGDVDTTGAFLLLSARGRLRFLQARYCDALFDLTESGRRQEALGIVSSAWAPWRPTASLALLALGEVDEALRVSATELRLARQFGAPRTLGVALRVAGLVQGDEHGIEYLREAVRVLAPSGANVEYARALADLGAALRRRGQSIEARDLLREAFAVASRCEAAAVGIHARSELEVAGGRPGRRIHHEGLEALTMSERRVAQLASLRLTNTEIAQTLFVTVKTVEAHLSSAYRKLGINSRRELALALRGEPPAQSLPSPMFRVNP